MKIEISDENHAALDDMLMEECPTIDDVISGLLDLTEQHTQIVCEQRDRVRGLESELTLYRAVAEAAERAVKYWTTAGMVGRRPDQDGFLEPEYLAINDIATALRAAKEKK